ncbi:mechanosensitive ion channel domain-containing protein [Halobacterium sp. NMX12-1]|uniref:Mechanosensitive ion channel domain-containing protein n=1 Tax=Halobacterium sp. NMX12-1 TaxID=3166650 RepID=A0AAU8CAI7_9EURY
MSVPTALQETTVESGPEALAELSPLLVSAAWFLAGVLGVAAVGWLVVGPLVDRVVRRRNRDNPTIQDAIARYVRLLALLVGVVVGVSVAGYGQFLSDSALVVAAGTLAVGVAAQTVIGSLVSGLVLVFDPEFSVGDYIEFGDHEGAVQSIQLRATRLETADGELVTVPNTALTNEVVVRPYGRRQYRLVDRVSVDYGDDLGDAVAAVTAAAASVDAVLDDPAPQAYVEELGDDAVVVRAHYWIPRPDPEEVLAARSAYTRAVEAALAAADVTVSPAQQHELSGRVGLDGGG